MSFNISYVAGGRFDPPFMPTKQFPWVKGNILQCTMSTPVSQVIEYSMPCDAELLSIAVGTSRYYPTDNWSFAINGKVHCENIYTKDLPEGMFFMAIIPVKTDDKLQFTFVNDEKVAKFVWFNYQFLKDAPADVPVEPDDPPVEGQRKCFLQVVSKWTEEDHLNDSFEFYHTGDASPLFTVTGGAQATYPLGYLSGEGAQFSTKMKLVSYGVNPVRSASDSYMDIHIVDEQGGRASATFQMDWRNGIHAIGDEFPIVFTVNFADATP